MKSAFAIVAILFLSSCSVINKASQKRKTVTASYVDERKDSVSISKVDSVGITKIDTNKTVVTYSDTTKETAYEKETTKVTEYDSTGKVKKVTERSREKYTDKTNGIDWVYDHSKIERTDSVSKNISDSVSDKGNKKQTVYQSESTKNKTVKKVSWFWLWVIVIAGVSVYAYLKRDKLRTLFT